MYEWKTEKKNNIYILILIIALVVLFTILAYTIFLDNHKYQYTQNVTATQVRIKETENFEDILERVTESTVGV